MLAECTINTKHIVSGGLSTPAYIITEALKDGGDGRGGGGGNECDDDGNDDVYLNESSERAFIAVKKQEESDYNTRHF